MGIRFLDSILMLLAAAAFVFAAYLVGHALSAEHAGWAWVSAGVTLAASLLLTAFLARRLRGYARRRESTQS
jgi:membrane protein implicated in regulation of membrane protease activity